MLHATLTVSMVVPTVPLARLSTASLRIRAPSTRSASLYSSVFITCAKPAQDHVVYDEFNGIVFAEEEGQNIAKKLGDKKLALLQNHGLLTVGDTVEEAVFWFVSAEKCCHAQLMADAAADGTGGKTIKIDHEDAVYTKKAVGSKKAGWFSAKPMFDMIHKETNGDYLQ